MIKKKDRVVVAMSGGVDSSVAAALLKSEGYEVVGVTMQIAPLDLKKGGGKADGSDVTDAKRAAENIGIKHYVINFRKIFSKKIVNNFIDEYEKGRTPNPCVRCNKFIKFDALLKFAKELKGDLFATGHYARIDYSRSMNRWLIKKALDCAKDQSYVLYSLRQHQLRNTIFPLGELDKRYIREMAHKINLCVADKPESQEVCFAREGYGDFVRAYLGPRIKPGPILNLDGDVIGKHKGIVYYTIGQRRGLGLAAAVPLYVTAIDARKNAIIAGPEKFLYRKEFSVDKVNFISVEKIDCSMDVKVKIRYMHKAANAVIIPLNRRGIKVIFKTPQRAVTPGQSAVFYRGDVVVGGGVIKRSSS